MHGAQKSQFSRRAVICRKKNGNMTMLKLAIRVCTTLLLSVVDAYQTYSRRADTNHINQMQLRDFGSSQFCETRGRASKHGENDEKSDNEYSFTRD